ncbi:MAG TPA: LacI family DNA-binding transcriptional regulator [Ktedonobacteraceae bacterium]|nr:LacI family DNA-binding transcriptional regulator [Ktedonobacteraceae bacterium]
MRQHEISIADIARVAGVSHTTVSRALRGNHLISLETRERIQRLAQEMGYTPNAIAQSLQTRSTSTIGLVVTSIADPFLNDVVKGVEEVARAANFSVLLSATHNDPEQEMVVIETFHRRRVDGILVASSRITSAYKQRLDHIRVPTVIINSQADSQNELLNWVSVDDRFGACLAVEHLLQLGHRDIGYLGISSRPRSNRQRFQGYQGALAAAGIPFCEKCILVSSGTEASHEEDVAVGQASLQHFLDNRVTAIFCYNDMAAVGLLMACRERGIDVPGQLSVVGFDDIKLASYVSPALTTVRQPKLELGRLATEVMLDLLHNRPGKNHLLQPELITRASTALPVSVAGARKEFA